MRHIKAMLVLLGMVLTASLASAQYMILDTDGDGGNDKRDKIGPAGTTTVGIWIQTDRYRDGSPVGYAGPRSRPLTMNSYEFILRAEGGTVEWGEYQNLQPTMDVAFGARMNDREYYNGYAGLEALPPGKYKLGAIKVRVKAGAPSIVLGATTSLWSGARTSFGSQREGKDGDNTLKFTEDRGTLGAVEDHVPGDWSDGSRLEFDTAAASAAAMAPSTGAFAVSISPNPANPYALVQVKTTRSGRLRVQVFDVAGRLVRTTFDEVAVPPGVHVAPISVQSNGQPLASGVYLYRVEASEGIVTGRVVILK